MKTKTTIADQRRKNTRNAYLFLFPALAILLVFSVIPIIYSFGLSFFQWDMLSGGPKFIGLKNYIDLITNGELYHSLGLTVMYTILTVFPSMIFGFIFAILLDRKFRGIGFYRSFFFAPLMTSTVAISAIWMWIYHADYGILNQFLGFFGIPPYAWLNDTKTALIALIIMGIWKNIGFCMTLYIGGLQNISDEVLEAAQMDGSGQGRMIRKIKIPLVAPTTFMLLILLTIEQFQTFTQVNVMTGGGPANSTRLLVPLLYEKAFVNFEMGDSSAISVILFIIVMILTLIQLKVIGKKIHYQ